jgi:hypothetical protein
VDEAKPACGGDVTRAAPDRNVGGDSTNVPERGADLEGAAAARRNRGDAGEVVLDVDAVDELTPEPGTAGMDPAASAGDEPDGWVPA